MGKKISSYVITILLIMVGIFAIKKISGKYNIPVVSKLSEGV